MNKYRNTYLKYLKKIPGIYIKIKGDLWNIGVRTTDDVDGKNPDELYQQLCVLQD